MLIKGLLDEDFVNYSAPSMFIITSYCDFKCDLESGASCCQNSSLAKEKPTAVADDIIITKYIKNPITHAIVFGGLEPMLQFEEVFAFISKLRNEYQCNDTVVIYTGYNKCEVEERVEALSSFDNIIMKFGRFIPYYKQKYDDVLGITLSSSNQYAERIS